MKDAKGHGSDPRAGHKLAADFRAAHQSQFHTIPTLAQTIGAELKRFSKDPGGAGKSFLHEAPDDAEKYQNVGESYGEVLKGMSQGHTHLDPSHLMHLAHFLHSMAALAVADVLVRCIFEGWGGLT